MKYQIKSNENLSHASTNTKIIDSKEFISENGLYLSEREITKQKV